MQETYDFIWVIAEKDRQGKWRKMSKCYDEKFFLSAEDAFDFLGKIDPDIAKSFGVFEIPVFKVWEIKSPKEEGISIGGVAQ